MSTNNNWLIYSTTATAAMEVSSPPKRITRARAAAKTTTSTTSTASVTASAAKTTKAATAAAKPTSAAAKATTARMTTSMKRKTRCDENEEEEESRRPTEASITEITNKPAKTRGRPKKVVESAPQPGPEPEQEQKSREPAPPAVASATAARATRGRTKKVTEEAPKPEPVKATRTRTKKATVDEDKVSVVVESVKKAARGRPAANAAKSSGTICTEPTTNPTPGLKSNITRPTSRLAITKKTVSFQEPEKENAVLPPHSKAKVAKPESDSATGMRAKPVRKTASATRATRASARTTTSTTTTKRAKPIPLSPQKDAPNRPLSRSSNSDDELAAYEKTPLKPLMKSPVKPPHNKKIDNNLAFIENSETRQNTEDDDELAGTSVFASPAKRLPSTPFKDTIKSPAKRAGGVPTLLFSAKNDESETTQSPSKTSILQSPAKRPQMPLMAFQAPSHEHPSQPRSPMKMSLLQSPAKRPLSAVKLPGTSLRPLEDKIPLSLAQPSVMEADEPEEVEVKEAYHVEQEVYEPENIQPENIEPENLEPENIEPIMDMVHTSEDDDDSCLSHNHDADALALVDQLEFPGRLSAVLPRHADPALQDKLSPSKALSAAQLEPTTPATPDAVESLTTGNAASDPSEQDAMDIDIIETDAVDHPESPPAGTPPRPALWPQGALFKADGGDSAAPKSGATESVQTSEVMPETQDDVDLNFDDVPATPTPQASKTPRSGLPSSAIKNASRAIRSVSRASKLGFTPLAKPLSDWRAGSPLKNSTSATSPSVDEEYSLVEDSPTAVGTSPAKDTFFDDEMRIRGEMDGGIGSDAEAEMMAAIEADLAASFEDPVFDDIPVTNEDVELAAEANGMSLLESDMINEVPNAQTHDDSISEGSQEYGDENAVPIDPALLGHDASHSRQSMASLPVTPVRPASRRAFNTTTKIPLKAADDSTPKSVTKRSASASRHPPQRPAGPTRNATVISYSPTKDTVKLDNVELDDVPPVTPTKSDTDIWSSMGTPARTPRRDLNPVLLRGAVVFVDVHTSEGADASTIFVDLLTQMGARCVKSWPWNPSSSAEGDYNTSKIGLTHVVYKDGGKRTMEKVRDSGGVVQCVGVGWVLE